MIKHINISTEEFKKKFKNREICFGGNARLKIYGLLKCSSGKRMKKKTVFFFVLKKKHFSTAIAPADIA